MQALAQFALRAGAATAGTAVAWWWGGPVPGVTAAALSALLLSRSVLDVVAELRHGLRAAALDSIEGRHYAFHGKPVQVLEDADHRRWVRVSDVRRIVGFTASDGALELTYPSGFRRFGREAHLSDDALLLHLAREPAAAALKFRHWAEREITFPARRVRERLGIRVAAPEAQDAD